MKNLAECGEETLGEPYPMIRIVDAGALRNFMERLNKALLCLPAVPFYISTEKSIPQSSKIVLKKIQKNFTKK